MDVHKVQFGSRGVLLTVLLAAVVLIVGHFGAGVALYVDAFEPVAFLPRLNLDVEYSIGTWLGTVYLFVIAALAGVLARVSAVRGDRVRWSILSLMVLAVSIDEVTRLHERAGEVIRDSLDTSGFLYFAWVIPAAVVVLVMAAAYLRFLYQLASPAGTLLICGAAIYVSGALGLELLGGQEASEGGGRQSARYYFITGMEGVA